MSTVILWDIDGTLIRNEGGKAGSVYVHAMTELVGVAPTEKVPDPHGMTEGQLLRALLQVNGHDPDRLAELYPIVERLSHEEHAGGRVRTQCPGVPEALDAVAARGWTNALLTGNGPDRARHKLAAAGLDLDRFDWDGSFFGHDQPTREHLTAGARERLTGRHAFIIGDTPKDGAAADHAGIPFLAVATGTFSAAALRDTSALIVVDDLESGLDALLAVIDQAVAA